MFNKKNLSLPTRLLSAALFLFSFALAAETSANQIISLSGTWKLFKYSPKSEDFQYDASKEASFAQPGTTDEKWSDITVPFFAKIAQEKKVYWCRKEFQLPEGGAKSLQIRFGAVQYQADVFLNGKYLGTHKGGLGTPFEFEGGAFAEWGKNNLLAVRVTGATKYMQSLTVRKKLEAQGEGFFSYYRQDGIWQDVEARISGDVYSKDFSITSNLNEKNVETGFIVKNTGVQKKTVKIEALVFPKKNNTELTGKATAESVEIDAGKEKEICFKIALKDPVCWDTENPFLYTLQCRISDGSTVNDSRNINFGFRTFEARGADFFLNGKKIYIRGAMCARDTFDCTLMLNDKFAKRMFLLAKEANCNFLRFWNSCRPEFYYDLADEMGILLDCEFGFNVLTANAENPAVYDSVLEQVKDAVLDCRTHPSVIMFTLENEHLMHTDYNKENTIKFYGAMHKLCRSLAPGIPVSDGAGAFVDNPWDWYLQDTDIFSIHQYPGWYNEGVQHFIQARFKHFIEKAKKLNKPLALTEYDGAYTLRPEEDFKVRGGYGHQHWLRWAYATWTGKDDKALVEEQMRYQYWLVDNMSRGLRRLRVPLISCTSLGSWFEDKDFMKPTKTYYILQAAYAPLLASIECYKKNYFAGDPLEAACYIINDHLEDKKVSFEWEVKRRSRQMFKSERQTMDIPYGELVKVPLAWKIPDDIEKEDYTIIANIYSGDKLVSTDKFTITGMERDSLSATDKNILLFDPRSNGNTEKVLKESSVKYTRISKIEDLEKIKKQDYDLLIIGTYALGTNYSKTVKDQLSDWLDIGSGEGRSILVLEQGAPGIHYVNKFPTPNGNNFPVSVQYEQSRYGEDRVTLMDPTHPVFTGLCQEDFFMWNGNCGFMGNLFLAKDPKFKRLISLGMMSINGHWKILDTDALVEFEKGFEGGVGHARESRLVFSQLDAVSRYDSDPIARKYINNLLKYCLR